MMNDILTLNKVFPGCTWPSPVDIAWKTDEIKSILDKAHGQTITGTYIDTIYGGGDDFFVIEFSNGELTIKIKREIIKGVRTNHVKFEADNGEIVGAKFLGINRLEDILKKTSEDSYSLESYFNINTSGGNFMLIMFGWDAYPPKEFSLDVSANYEIVDGKSKKGGE